MKRKIATNFQHGDIEAHLEVQPDAGVAPLTQSAMDNLHRGLITPIVNRLLPGISALIDTLDLKKGGEYSTNVVVPVAAQVGGYTCEVKIQIDVGVKISQAVLEAVVLLHVAPSFLQEVGRLVASHATDMATQESGYGEVLSQKLVEAFFGSQSPDTPSRAGGMYL